MYNYDPHIGN